MAYSKQTWDTTSYVNPTRMNHIEDGIYDATTPTTVTTGLTPVTGATLIAFRCNIQGGFKNLYAIIQLTFSSYSSKVIGTLPESCRPTNNIELVFANTTKNTAINGMIRSNGEIIVYPISGNVDFSAQNITILTTFV